MGDGAEEGKGIDSKVIRDTEKATEAEGDQSLMSKRERIYLTALNEHQKITRLSISESRRFSTNWNWKK